MNIHQRGIKYLQQKLIDLKEKISKSTTMFGDFNISLLTIDRTTREHNEYRVTEQYYWPARYNWHLLTIPPKEVEHTVFLSTYGTYTR